MKYRTTIAKLKISQAIIYFLYSVAISGSGSGKAPRAWVLGFLLIVMMCHSCDAIVAFWKRDHWYFITNRIVAIPVGAGHKLEVSLIRNVFAPKSHLLWTQSRVILNTLRFLAERKARNNNRIVWKQRDSKLDGLGSRARGGGYARGSQAQSRLGAPGACWLFC